MLGLGLDSVRGRRVRLDSVRVVMKVRIRFRISVKVRVRVRV